MRKLLPLLLAAAILFSACGDPTPPDIDVIAEGSSIRTEFVTPVSADGDVYRSDWETSGEGYPLDEDTVRSLYGDATSAPDMSSVESYYVYVDLTAPTKPCEFGIFKLADGADTATFRSFLRSRVDLLIENAKNYPSVDTSPLTSAVFGVRGGYVWYAAVKDANKAIDDRMYDLLRTAM